MTTEPKPMDLPPMPEVYLAADTEAALDAVTVHRLDELQAHARQLAEIAQAQAALADGLAEALENERRIAADCLENDCYMLPENQITRIDNALRLHRENRHA